MQRSSPLLCFLTMLVVGGLTTCGPGKKVRGTLPSTPGETPRIEFTGEEAGWPPQPKGAINVTRVVWEEIPGSLTDELESRIREAALRDARVREALGNRFSYISTDARELEKGRLREPTQPLSTRVVFFSHTRNVALEVYMLGTAVENVTIREGYDPPEGKEEIDAAVALAESDPRLRGQLEGLTGAALVAFPQAGQPGYRHRVLDVTFTREGEDLPRYFALVDLTDQKVLVAGPTSARGRR